LDPDILLTDGVLTVGDSSFRARCRAALEERIEQGLTVVLAADNAGTVRRLCSDALWLREGRVEALGPADEVVPRYEAEMASKAAGRARAAAEESDSPSVSSEDPGLVLKTAGIYDMDGKPAELLRTTDDALMELTFELRDAPKRLRCLIDLVEDGRKPVRFASREPFDVLAPGVYAASVHVPAGTLPPASYRAQAAIRELSDEEQALGLASASFHFETVGDDDTEPDPARALRPRLPWDLTRIAQFGAA
jgi:hypothetical protein